MKLAAVADIHLGNHRRFGGEVSSSLNRRCRLGVTVFERAVNRALAQQCDGIAIVGDLFDTTHPEPQLITEVLRIVSNAEHEGVDVFLLVGNHDQVSLEKHDHALGPFRQHACIIDTPRVVHIGHGPNEGYELVCVPYRPGVAKDWLPDALSDILGRPSAGVGSSSPPMGRLLALHCGIADARTPVWLKDAHDAVHIDLLEALCRKHSISTVIAGNWHDRRRWELKGLVVQQLGALVPTGFDNPGMTGYGTVGYVESDEDGGLVIDFEELSGPRFVKYSGDDVGSLVEQNEELGNRLFVQWTVMPDKLREATETIEGLVKEGALEDGEAFPDGDVVEAAARSAAHTARSSDTLEEALAGFVEQMQLDDDVDRAEVLARSKRYLNV